MKFKKINRQFVLEVSPTCWGRGVPKYFPNKNVIQGMASVYSQTESGHPDVEDYRIKKLIFI